MRGLQQPAGRGKRRAARKPAAGVTADCAAEADVLRFSLSASLDLTASSH
ncbi:hypothetical protein BV133_1468 [Blastochloris viridis]|uniref:Uncharacterized protein n=1 Tax=Blastochloris viridis TaxID=1079 RepID=A0A182D2D7_BLAVI|nr:hypothetical protein BV133_1468 [Blastochloris viridis]